MQICLVHRGGFRQQNHQAGTVQSFDVGNLDRDDASAQLLGPRGRA